MTEALSSLMNFRDLGGAPVPGGTVAPCRLYRTGHLSQLSEEAAAHLAHTLGIRVYIDFRVDHDIVRDGEPKALLRREVVWARHPFDISDAEFQSVRIPFSSDWQQLYFRAVKRLQPEISGVVRAIAAQATPVMFGCWVGKDRTGIVAAFLLSLLGVDDAWIGQEFAKTNQLIQPFKTRFSFL